MEPGNTNGADKQHKNGVEERDSMAHHLRTPLTVVYGYVQLLQRRLRRGQVPNNEELLRTLGHIDQAARAIESHLKEVGDKAGHHKNEPDAE